MLDYYLGVDKFQRGLNVRHTSELIGEKRTNLPVNLNNLMLVDILIHV